MTCGRARTFRVDEISERRGGQSTVNDLRAILRTLFEGRKTLKAITVTTYELFQPRIPSEDPVELTDIAVIRATCDTTALGATGHEVSILLMTHTAYAHSFRRSVFAVMIELMLLAAMLLVGEWLAGLISGRKTSQSRTRYGKNVWERVRLGPLTGSKRMKCTAQGERC